MNKEDTVRFIRSLLITKKDLYEIPDLLKDFEEQAGYCMPYFGHKTAVEFLRSLCDSLQVITACGKTYLKPIDSSKTAHISSLVKRQDSSKRNVLKRGRFSVYKSITRSFNQYPLHVKSETTKDQRKFMKFMDENEFERISITNNDDKTLDNTKCNDVDIPSGKCSSNDSNVQNLSFPGKIVTSIIVDETEIPKLNLRVYANIDDYIEVCVPEVCNPHKFILQLRKFKIRLNKLMRNLQSFYKQPHDKYMVNISELKKNQLCVAPYRTNTESQEWYRAKILDCGIHASTVLLIDYGIITEVENCNLRYLGFLFGDLPAQALQGHLANIRPLNNSNWSEESCKRFLELALKKDLVAGVVDLNYEELWLSVALSYTNGEDVHINDTLVQENLAAFDYDDLVVDKSSFSVQESAKTKLFLQSEDSERSVSEESAKTNDGVILKYCNSNDRLRQMFSCSREANGTFSPKNSNCSCISK